MSIRIRKGRCALKIVVVGSGRVGRTIVTQLANENHDVTVIDRDKNEIEDVGNEADVLGVCGNGAAQDVLKEAGIEKADLLIAVTANDEINMLCCLLGKKLGAKNTIARVRNPEYVEQMPLLRDDLGLSMVINPESAAANDMFRTLRFPAAMKIDSFSRGKVEIVTLRLDEKNPMVGKSLIQIAKSYSVRVLVCAVQRGDEVLIPSGDFVLMAGDLISVTAPSGDIEEFFRQTGVMRPQVKSVMIVGGGRAAFYLARRLLQAKIRVRIIEEDIDRCRVLSEILPGAEILNGDGTDQRILREEGISNTEAFVSMTGVDEENIVLSMFAKSMGVSKIITRINNSALKNILYEVGLDGVVTPKDITAGRIVSYVRAMANSYGSSIESLHRIVEGRVEALEFKAKEGSPVIGIPLRDLRLKSGLLVASITRGRRAIIPGGGDTIEADDRVVVVSNSLKLEDLSDILA